MWWVSGLCQSCPLSGHEAALVSSDLASTLELLLKASASWLSCQNSNSRQLGPGTCISEKFPCEPSQS